jgi:hypothetical protein
MWAITWRTILLFALMVCWYLPLLNVLVLPIQLILAVGVVARVWKRATAPAAD